MLSLKRFIASLVVIGGCLMPASAQNGLSVYTGGNAVWGGALLLLWTVSNLGDDEEEDYAYVENGEGWEEHTSDSGHSPNISWGANAGLKYQFGFLGNLAMFASMDVFYRELNDGAVKGSRILVGDEMQPSNVNFPALLGFNYTVKRFPNASLWVEAGTGISFRRITMQGVVSGVWPHNVEIAASRRWGVFPAWKAGVGITSPEGVSLELCCHAFSNSEVRGALFAGEDNVVVDWAHKLAKGFVSDRLRLPMICVRFGYCF